jgi:hypothetical protein
MSRYVRKGLWNKAMEVPPEPCEAHSRQEYRAALKWKDSTVILQARGLHINEAKDYDGKSSVIIVRLYRAWVVTGARDDDVVRM